MSCTTPSTAPVTCAEPGAVPLPIEPLLPRPIDDHPLGRIGTPEDIAEAVDYLLRAEWTTGASVVVDGGLALGVSYK